MKARRVWWVLAGSALAVAVIVALLVPQDGVRTVTTDPVGQGTRMAPASPGAAQPAATPGGPLSATNLLATETATDGRPWTLYIGGPWNTLCLAVALVPSDNSVGGCADSSGSPTDRNRPQVFAEDRTPAFAFGSMPADVVEVSVLLLDGTTLGRHPVIQVPAGTFYVVQLPSEGIRAVLGLRKDGTTVRSDR